MPHSPDDPAAPHWLKTKVSSWFWSLSPDCREVARLTSEGRERPLPLGMRFRLSLHRCFCTWCARYAKQLDLLQKASQAFPEHVDQAGGPALASDAKARLKQALRESQG